ncbi:unnamed protein product, partial [Staurois parvus]
SIIGISGRNCAPSLVSVGGIAPHHWYQWQELRPIIGVSGENSAPSLVSVGRTVPHRWCQWGRNSASSLVSCGRNSAPSLVSLTPMMGHNSSH